MSKTFAKLGFLAFSSLLVLNGSAGQEKVDAPPYPTGLVLPTDERIAEIHRTWPRVIKAGVNWLGFERINEVRKAKGKVGLDPASVRPVGREVESAVLEAGAVVQAYTVNADIAADIPVSVDNSRLKYFPPIRSQAPLGSCVSFCTTYTQFSYMNAFQRDLDIRDPGDDTNKYSPKWTYNLVNGGGDNGSWFDGPYQLLEVHGAATWAEFPYDDDCLAWCLDPAVWRRALSVRATPPQYITGIGVGDAGLQALKETLANGYVLAFGTFILSWEYKPILDDPSTDEEDSEVGKNVGVWVNGSQGEHGMIVVGYNDAIWTDVNGNGMVDPGEKGALKVANSWGPSWEDGGFIWLAYDALRRFSSVSGGPDSTLRSQAFVYGDAYIQTARDAYSPLMIAEFTLHHAKRNQIRLTQGTSSISETSSGDPWGIPAFWTQGGPYAFDGTETAVDGTFVVDYSDFMVAGAGLRRYHLGVTDTRVGDPATLRAFKLIDLTTAPPTETVCVAVPQTADYSEISAYVDYSYAGPGFNTPPVLSGAQVSPGLGTPSDIFVFTVHYQDPDRDPPITAWVLIDARAHAMTLAAGTASDGWYRYETRLPVGIHDHRFYFEDCNYASGKAPPFDVFEGPGVYDLLVSDLSPDVAMAGGPAFTLSVTGSTFANGAVVRWDGSDRPTTFVSGSLVTAAIPASDLAAGKVVVVTVRNPDGGLSSPLNFTVNNTVPALSSLSPARASGGGSGLTLTVAGSGFVPGALVQWDNVAKTTTFVSPTQLQAQITSVDIGASGDHNVTVQNPPPGGGESGTIVFPVSGFTVASSTASATVTAGQSASYTIRVTPQSGPFDSPVTLSCPTLARGVTASFSPASVTPGVAEATSQLTLTTTARQSSGAGSTFASSGAGPFGTGLLLLAASALLVLAAARLGLPRRLVRRSAAAVAALGLIALIAACSSDGGGGPTNTGTPAGTYQVGVRGASGGMIISTTVELVVR